MLIVAGWLRVHAGQRDAYLAAAGEATRLARASACCLEFVQAPDPLAPDRIVILERWESAAALEAFRTSGTAEPPALPHVLDAEVRRYTISSVDPA